MGDSFLMMWAVQSHPGVAGLSTLDAQTEGGILQQAHLVQRGFQFSLYFILLLQLPLAFCIVAGYLWEAGLCRVGWTLCSSNGRHC